MGRRAGHKERAEETGMILAELAAGLPIIVLFLTFLMVAVLWSRQNYARQIADAELRQEMQIAAARIVESALLSDHIGESQRSSLTALNRIFKVDTKCRGILRRGGCRRGIGWMRGVWSSTMRRFP